MDLMNLLPDWSASISSALSVYPGYTWQERPVNGETRDYREEGVIFC
jgi:hypothetical protein